MNIRILRSARRTITDGIRFYESQEPGLGAYFLNSIMSDLRSLKIYAGIHQVYEGTPYYRMICKRFPYSIYYKITVPIFSFTPSSTTVVIPREIGGCWTIPSSSISPRSAATSASASSGPNASETFEQR